MKAYAKFYAQNKFTVNTISVWIYRDKHHFSHASGPNGLSGIFGVSNLDQ